MLPREGVLGSFGERLRREREMRGVSLEEISAATKIGTRSLRALEDEQFEKLPGGIFNKGFVRAYAKFLGINEEQTVADYLTAAGEAEPEPEQMLAGLAAENARRAEMKREAESDSGGMPRIPWTAIGIVVIVVVLGVAGWKFYQNRRHARAEREAAAATVQQSTISAAVPQKQPESVTPPVTSPATTPPTPAETQTPRAGAPNPTASTPTPAASTSTTPNEAGFLVTIHAREECWVKATADGKSVLNATLKAATETPIRANKVVNLTVGNAGGVEVSFNGKPQPPLGPIGQRRNVVFTSSGQQQ